MTEVRETTTWLSGWPSWPAPSPRRASVEDVLRDVTAAAKELIPGVDAAGVLLIGKGGKFESLGGTSELPHQLDELQMKYQRGAVRAGGTRRADRAHR